MARTRKSQKIAKQKTNYLSALRWFGVQVSKKLGLDKIRAAYKAVRKGVQKEEGIQLPRVDVIAKQQIEKETKQKQEPYYSEEPQAEQVEIPTLEFGEEYIRNFTDTLKQILDDTIKSIREDMGTSGRGSRQAGYFRSLRETDIETEYRAILEAIESKVSQYGFEATAQALKDSVALDYTQAIVFVPPSDTHDNFEVTLEEITSMTIQSLDGMNS